MSVGSRARLKLINAYHIRMKPGIVNLKIEWHGTTLGPGISGGQPAKQLQTAVYRQNDQWTCSTNF